MIRFVYKYKLFSLLIYATCTIITTKCTGCFTDPATTGYRFKLDHNCRFICIVWDYDWNFHIFYATLER